MKWNIHLTPACHMNDFSCLLSSFHHYDSGSDHDWMNWKANWTKVFTLYVFFCEAIIRQLCLETILRTYLLRTVQHRIGFQWCSYRLRIWFWTLSNKNFCMNRIICIPVLLLFSKYFSSITLMKHTLERVLDLLESSRFSANGLD